MAALYLYVCTHLPMYICTYHTYQCTQWYVPTASCLLCTWALFSGGLHVNHAHAIFAFGLPLFCGDPRNHFCCLCPIGMTELIYAAIGWLLARCFTFLSSTCTNKVLTHTTHTHTCVCMFYGMPARCLCFVRTSGNATSAKKSILIDSDQFLI